MIGRLGILVTGCMVFCGHALGYSAPTSAFAPKADAYARKGGCPGDRGSSPEDKNYAFWPANAGPNDHSTPLLLFLPGHGSKVDDYTDFLAEAARKGYFVIGLAYRNGQTVQNMCGFWADCAGYLFEQNVEKNTYRGFYSCGSPHDQAAQAAADNAINPRLGKFLSHLQGRVANGFNWKQYYDYTTDNVNWSRIVVAGHSEGGATATWITKNKPVMAGIVFEAPYTDWDNGPTTDSNGVTHNDGRPEDKQEYTPCYSKSACPYTARGGVKDPTSFASYLHNDGTGWVNKLWVTLNSHDAGYGLVEESPRKACTAGSASVCGDGICDQGVCKISPWRGLNMQGATAALGKHEHTFSSPPGALNGDKWWTSTVQPTGNCNGQPAVGHTATVVNGCSPSWMPQYWDRVLAAVWQPVQPGGNGVCKQACMTTEGSCMLQAHSGPERGACAREMESCQARCSD